MAFETYSAMPGKPCSGNNTCCNRPEFDRAMFPCDRATQLAAEADRLASRVAELEALVRAQAERIAAQSELLSKVAELRAVLAPPARS